MFSEDVRMFLAVLFVVARDAPRGTLPFYSSQSSPCTTQAVCVLTSLTVDACARTSDVRLWCYILRMPRDKMGREKRL